VANKTPMHLGEDLPHQLSWLAWAVPKMNAKSIGFVCARPAGLNKDKFKKNGLTHKKSDFPSCSHVTIYGH